MSPRLRADISVCDTDDTLVLLDERTGRYWQLNRTGALILHALLNGATPHQAATTLTDTHQVAPRQATADVDALLDQLTHATLVTR